MRTSNPALNNATFTAIARTALTTESMTIQGTVNKSLVLLVLLCLSAIWTWRAYLIGHDPRAVIPWLLIGGIGGLIVALITVFKKAWSPVTAPVYALLEGLVLGGISSIFETLYPGVVIQAVGLTFGTLFGLLLAYKSGLIRATEKFKLGVVAATGGIALFYIITMILGLFNIHISYIYENGLIGIGFSLFVVVIAALNLVLDFDFIEQGATQGVPRYMEWYGAFGLMVTLIWLYLEILRLLSKMRSRRD
ncbi:MAG TPA: Bax inhibitor-1/YccA family protein [Nitrospirota bacterium]|nr:Bax inhibitor-1/YccA family protein [Nitrospirota bacterium]